MSVPIAIFASGRGSNFEVIADACAAGRLDASVVVLVCDRPGAPVLDAAKRRGIPALLIPPPAVGPGISPAARQELRELHDREILAQLSPYAPRFLVFAGYLRRVSRVLIEEFRGERGQSRIVNVHPSLLPAFPGLGSYARAFAHGAKVAGVTVHLVEEELDLGPICAQEAFSIADCRTAGEVERRGLAIEHRLYPETLGWILKESFEMQDREGRPCVCPN
ncbi:MAG: phosphoribosylglycinamide formyltransferase [Oligoflexia bacterium]|nr:phosphoribosylglycinamide formyltransferase [Oligoflexia bacterium]